MTTLLRRLKLSVGSVIALGGLSIKERGGMRDAVSLYGNSLAEWEVMVLNRCVYQSIVDIFLRVGESESAQHGLRQRWGISTAKSKEWDLITTTRLGSMQPSLSWLSLSSFMMSPSQVNSFKRHLSPWGVHATMLSIQQPAGLRDSWEHITTAMMAFRTVETAFFGVDNNDDDYDDDHNASTMTMMTR